MKYGWAVIDSLLGDKESSEVRLEVERLYADGTFVNGTTAKSLPSETVRGDKVQWWSSDQNSGPVGNLITQLDLIMAEVSKLLNDKKEKSIMGKTKVS